MVYDPTIYMCWCTHLSRIVAEYEEDEYKEDNADNVLKVLWGAHRHTYDHINDNEDWLEDNQKPIRAGNVEKCQKYI